MPFTINNQQSCTMLSKFKGCLSGGLIGDCLGRNFEGKYNIRYSDIHKDWTTSELYFYTDDTAFTFDCADTLIKNRGIDMVYLAKSFAKTYANEPNRGYGNNIGKVLKDLEELIASRNLAALQPDQLVGSLVESAKNQFKGLGSYGNGAAMRIAPISLFFYKCDLDAFVRATLDCSLMTHYNAMAVVGALLQGMAIREALVLQQPPTLILSLDSSHRRSSSLIDGSRLALETLQSLLGTLEVLKNSPLFPSQFGLSEAIAEYCGKLETIKKFLQTPDLCDGDIVDQLGNGVAATKSVPTALYLALRAIVEAFNPIPKSSISQATRPNKDTVDTGNFDMAPDDFFRRAIYHAIKLGGDTDTIASMTGSILGAWIGLDHPSFPESWKNIDGARRFEGSAKAINLAQDLHSTITVAGTTHQNEMLS